ncbi:hypothetical protein ABIF79_003153 [Bradyrhizobium japonicum]
MTIASYTPTSNFTMIANDCFRDERLSYEALAIFTYLRSKPRDWKVMQTELAKRFKSGRDRVRNAINELVAAGYIRKVQERVAKTGRWSTVDYDVLALPDAPSPERPMPEAPLPENRSLLSTDLLPSTDSTKEQSNIRLAADAADASAVDEPQKAAPSPITANPLPASSDRSPRIFRQSQVEAAQAWEELRRMDWQSVWGDDELPHWHALLRKEHAADDIVNTAAAFLRETPFPDVPSLGEWLACFESYLEDEAGGVTALRPMPRVPVTAPYSGSMEIHANGRRKADRVQ